MKKKMILLICAVVLAAACVAAFFCLRYAKDSKYRKTLESRTYTGKIINIDSGRMIVAADEQSADCTPVCDVRTARVQITNADGKKAAKSALDAGDSVKVEYLAEPGEDFPEKIELASRITITAHGDNPIDAYIEAVDMLYNEDTALNDGISRIAFDLSAVENLGTTEKSGLIWLCNKKYGMETIEATFDSLCEFGYIDRQKNEFNDGILFTIEQTESDEDGFAFNIKKWRSALGMYGFYGCSARKDGDGWKLDTGKTIAS